MSSYLCQERNKGYSVYLVGLELNIYVTKMYGTTNIKIEHQIHSHIQPVHLLFLSSNFYIHFLFVCGKHA
jgi:hypothetical protein